MRLQDWQIRKAASNLELTPGERLVLFTLNSYGEEIFPSLKTIVEDTGFTRQGYQKIRKSLVAKGVLTWNRRKGKSSEVHLNYAFLLDMTTELHPMTTELSSMETELSSMTTEVAYNTNPNTITNTNNKSNDTQAMKSPGSDDESSLAKNNSTSTDESVLESKADKEPGDKASTSRMTTELTNPYADMTPEELKEHIENLQPEPIEHTGWRKHRRNK